jgi:hypothetical protein
VNGTEQFLGYAGMCAFAIGAVVGTERLMKRATYLPVKRTDSSDEQEGADS